MTKPQNPTELSTISTRQKKLNLLTAFEWARYPQVKSLKITFISGGATRMRHTTRTQGCFGVRVSRRREAGVAQETVVQFSSTKLRTRANSRVLFVTSVNPRLRAWAAINKSLAPIIVASFFRAARI
jgi:hypothetical protein